jgi:molybdate transport system substrate-binding protein
MTTLHMLAAGASKGLVGALSERFTAETDCTIDGAFGAVGAMRERFLAGEACDVVILTDRQISELVEHGQVLRGTPAPLGLVRTGIAVPIGQPIPQVATAAALAEALSAARSVFIPDPERSTAGIHFMNVLRQLGIADAVRNKLRPFPNGAIAMRALADAGEADSIGCTQITEIKYTEGVIVAGILPDALGLSTIYTAGVTTTAASPDAARRLVALLTGDDSSTLRASGGFEPPDSGLALAAGPPAEGSRT